MREIKYRVWDSHRKRWLTDYEEVFISDEGHISITVQGIESDYLQRVEGVVCQYTGLKDKTGKEIYEGDILCWPKYEGKKHQTRWAVEWNEKEGRWSEWSPRNEAEIIGNIYEHPELLNSTE